MRVAIPLIVVVAVLIAGGSAFLPDPPPEAVEAAPAAVLQMALDADPGDPDVYHIGLQPARTPARYLPGTVRALARGYRAHRAQPAGTADTVAFASPALPPYLPSVYHAAWGSFPAPDAPGVPPEGGRPELDATLPPAGDAEWGCETPPLDAK